MTLKKFNEKSGTICPKVECIVCHHFFIPDDNEDKCCYCSQPTEEEKQVKKERKERKRMKANGI